MVKEILGIRRVRVVQGEAHFKLPHFHGQVTGALSDSSECAHMEIEAVGFKETRNISKRLEMFESVEH